MNAETLTADSTLPDSTYVDVAAVPWQPTRFPGIEAKTLMATNTGMSTVLMRWAPGARLPHHEHVAIEQTFVLEGSFADHDGVCRAGNYVWRRAGSRHDAWTDEGCLVLAVFLKPNTFFD
ncbi:cupin domain-containing protein [soil metagenome]